MTDAKRKVLLALQKEIDKRGLIRRCPKCHGNGHDIPCAYPNHNFRDCPLRTPLKEETP